MTRFCSAKIDQKALEQPGSWLRKIRQLIDNWQLAISNQETWFLPIAHCLLPIIFFQVPCTPFETLS